MRNFGKGLDGLFAALSAVQTGSSTGVLYSGRSPRLVFSGGVLVNVEGLPAPGDPGADPSVPSDIRGGARFAMSGMEDSGEDIHLEPAGDVGTDGGSAPLNAADLILDLSRSAPWEWLRGRLADRSLKPVLSAKPAPIQPGLSMTPLEAFIVNATDGRTTIHGIVTLSGSDEKEVHRSLFGLLRVGLLEVGARAAPAGEPRPPAGPGSEKEPPATRGLSALDDFLERTSPAGTAEPPASPAPDATDPPPPAGTAYAANPEVEEKLRLLEAWIAEIRGLDHFRLLGLERTADEDTIRRAYYRLARRYHPDRFHGPDFDAILPEAEKAFAAATEAYNTLADEKARAEYERDLAAAGGSTRKPEMDKAALARESYLRAKKHLEAEEMFDALRLLEEACKADPEKEDYWVLLGTVQEKNPRWRKKAEQSYLKATEINPSNHGNYLHLARLYRGGNLSRRAAEMFKKVLEWDPDNEEALEALAERKDVQAVNVASRLGSIFKRGKS